MLKIFISIFFTAFFIISAAANTGFPSDFPQIKDEGGLGAGTILTGFGGDLNQNRDGNRKNISRIPVILLHGNAGSAVHNQWGMVPIYNMLKKKGYNDSEIWAVSYFGENNSTAQMNDPYKTNINDVRNFIEAVRKYLNVEKVDIIGHSLGSVLGKGYILGLDSNGKWGGTEAHHENVSTFVALASAFYGLGPYSMSEFQTGGVFEKSSHIVNGIFDDTPYGAPVINQVGNYKNETSLHDGTITYVSIVGKGDFIDSQNSMTGRLVGANLNMTFDLGSGLSGHQKIISDEQVFETYFPYLSRQNLDTNKVPVTQISPRGGDFYGVQEISISASTSNAIVYYSLNHGPLYKYTSPIKISEDTTINAFSENQIGRSETIEVNFKKVDHPPFQEVTSTLMEHAQNGRITWQEFSKYLAKYGPQASVTLYKLNGSNVWTDIRP